MESWINSSLVLNALTFKSFSDKHEINMVYFYIISVFCCVCMCCRVLYLWRCWRSRLTDTVQDLLWCWEASLWTDTHTHIQVVIHLAHKFFKWKYSTWHALTLCVWLLHGSLSRSRDRLWDIPSRHCGRTLSVTDSWPYRLCRSVWGLESGCHGNHWDLMPRRRGMKWSPQETTAAAKTWKRKSVACREIKQICAQLDILSTFQDFSRTWWPILLLNTTDQCKPVCTFSSPTRLELHSILHEE